MITGVSTAALFLRLNNEDALPRLDELGVKTAEVFLTSYSEYGKEFGGILRERRGRVRIHSVHVLNTQFEPQLFAVHERVKKDAFFWLGKAMEGAREIGAKYYTFHGISRLKRSTRSGGKDDFAAWGKALREISDFCRAYGVTLCLENVEWAMYNRPGVFSRLKEYCPDLRAVLDVKQARISAYPYGMYLKETAGRLTHVHLTDVNENGKICLPGKGKTDFPELLKRLSDAGFDGALILEPYADGYSEIAELKRSCDYLDELLYKYGFADKTGTRRESFP